MFQPDYTDCPNCGTCDHNDYDCPCACHGDEGPSKHRKQAKEVQELRAELRETRAEMRRCHIKRLSCFNGGHTSQSYRLNARCFELETKIKRLLAER